MQQVIIVIMMMRTTVVAAVICLMTGILRLRLQGMLMSAISDS